MPATDIDGPCVHTNAHTKSPRTLKTKQEKWRGREEGKMEEAGEGSLEEKKGELALCEKDKLLCTWLLLDFLSHPRRWMTSSSL